MALMNPRTYRLREDQHQWLTRQADENGASLVLRRLIDEAMKRKTRKKQKDA